MKNLLLFCSILLIAACKKDSTPYSSEFDTSLQKWTSYKSSVNNSYSYTVSQYSTAGTGQYSETKINVQNGVVIGRAYTLHATNAGGALLASWVENKTTLNKNAGGAAAITLDAVYAEAKSDWLTADNKTNTIYFETDGSGLISMSGYSAKNCQDDCFVGVNIKSITPLLVSL